MTLCRLGEHCTDLAVSHNALAVVGIMSQVDAALGRVDAVIEDLIVELKMRGIYDCINIIVVSDHGGCIFLLVRQFLFCILLYNDFNLTLMSKYCTTVCIE